MAWWEMGLDSRERSSSTVRSCRAFGKNGAGTGVGLRARNEDARARLVLLVRGSAAAPVKRGHDGKKGGLSK
jgi:hypothetical protein